MGAGMYAEISRQGAQQLYQEKTGLHCMLYFSGNAPNPSYFTCIKYYNNNNLFLAHYIKKISWLRLQNKNLQVIMGLLFVQPSPCDL